MGLAGAVVGDDQQALLIGGVVELEVGEDDVDELLGHPIGDDEGSYVLSHLVDVVSLNQYFH